MAKDYTEKYKLVLPEGPDYYTINDANTNAIKIENALTELDTDITNLELEITNEINTKLDQIIGDSEGKIQSLQEIVQYLDENGQIVEELTKSIADKVSNETLDEYKNEISTYQATIDQKISDINANILSEQLSRETADNEIDERIGDLSTLTTANKNDLVRAINEVDSDVGSLSSLNIQASSIVNAINSVLDQIDNNSEENNAAQTEIIESLNNIRNRFPNILLINKLTNAVDSYVTYSKISNTQFNIKLNDLLVIYEGRCVSLNLTTSLTTSEDRDSEILYLGMIPTSDGTDPTPLNLSLSFNSDSLSKPQALIKFNIEHTTTGGIADNNISYIEWIDNQTLPYFGDSANISYWIAIYDMIKNKLRLDDLGINNELNVIINKITEVENKFDYEINNINNELEADIGSIDVNNSSSLVFEETTDNIYQVTGNVQIDVSLNEGEETKVLSYQANINYENNDSNTIYAIAKIETANGAISDVYISNELPYPHYNDMNSYLSYYNFKCLFTEESDEEFEIPVAAFNTGTNDVTYNFIEGDNITSDSTITIIENQIDSINNMTIPYNQHPLPITLVNFYQYIAPTISENQEIQYDLNNIKLFTHGTTRFNNIIEGESLQTININTDLSTNYGDIWVKHKGYDCTIILEKDPSISHESEGYIYIGYICITREQGLYYLSLSSQLNETLEISITLNDLLENIAIRLGKTIVCDTLNTYEVNANFLESTILTLFNSSNIDDYEILVLDDLKYIREIQSYLTLNDDLRAPSLEADSVSTNNLDSIDLVLHNYNNREESKFTLDDLKYLHNIQSMLTDSSLTLDYTDSLGGSASLNANLIEKLINLSDGQTYETLVNINNKLTEITNSVNNLLEVVNSYDTSITDLNDNVVFGTYEGNGQIIRFIDLGFTPAAVEIWTNLGEQFYRYSLYDTIRGNTRYNNTYGGLGIINNPVSGVNSRYNGKTYYVIEIVENGFNVSCLNFSENAVSRSVHSNLDDTTYYFKAYRKAKFVTLKSAGRDHSVVDTITDIGEGTS